MDIDRSKIIKISTVLSEINDYDGLKYFHVYDESFQDIFVSKGYAEAELVKIGSYFFIIKTTSGYIAYSYKPRSKSFVETYPYNNQEFCWGEDNYFNYMTTKEIEDYNKVWDSMHSKSNSEDITEDIESYKQKILEIQESLEKQVLEYKTKYEELKKCGSIDSAFKIGKLQEQIRVKDNTIKKQQEIIKELKSAGPIDKMVERLKNVTMTKDILLISNIIVLVAIFISYLVN